MHSIPALAASAPSPEHTRESQSPVPHQWRRLHASGRASLHGQTSQNPGLHCCACARHATASSPRQMHRNTHCQIASSRLHLGQQAAQWQGRFCKWIYRAPRSRSTFLAISRPHRDRPCSGLRKHCGIQWGQCLNQHPPVFVAPCQMNSRTTRWLCLVLHWQPTRHLFRHKFQRRYASGKWANQR